MHFRFLFISILLFLDSCDSPVGTMGMSNNIEESKKNGTFVCEYYPFTNPIVINDTLKLFVHSIYMEKHWFYNEDLKPVSSDSGYQLVLIADKGNLIDYNTKWLIGVDFEKNWRSCSKDAIMTDFKTLPPDTISWEVQRGWYLDSASRKQIIGKIQLYRKK